MRIFVNNLFFVFVVIGTVSQAGFSSSFRSDFDGLLKEKHGPVESKKIARILDGWDAAEVDDGEMNYGKSGQSYPVEISLFKEIVKRSNNKEKPNVLCLACGIGEQAIRMALLGARVKGYDIAPRMVEIANKHLAEINEQLPHLNLDVEFAVVDLVSDKAEELFQQNSFDFITAKLFFHFLSPSQQLLMMERIHGALKEGGELLLITQGAPFEKEALASIIGRVTKNPKAIDHGYVLVHMAELNADASAHRNSVATRFGFESFWPYAYFITKIDDSLNFEFGRNEEGVHESIKELPKWYSKKIIPTTLKHYKYNYETIEGTRNLLDQS